MSNSHVVENKELTRFKVGDKVKYLYDPGYGTVEITKVTNNGWYEGKDLTDGAYGIFYESEIEPIQPKQTKEELTLTQMVEALKDVTEQFQKKRDVLHTQETLLSEITYDLEEALRYLENASENIKDYLKEE